MVWGGKALKLHSVLNFNVLTACWMTTTENLPLPNNEVIMCWWLPEMTAENFFFCLSGPILESLMQAEISNALSRFPTGCI